MTATQQTYIDAYSSESLYGFGDFYYGPSVDGDIIRDLPSNEWKQGHFTKTPLLVDRNGYEGFYFSNQSELTTEGTTADLQELFPYAKQHFFDRLYQLYPTDAFNSTFWQRQTIFGDFIINCPTYYMASAMSDMGVPTYKLIFNAGTQKHGATGSFIAESNDSPGELHSIHAYPYPQHHTCPQN
jgi:carboxylesterase type B